MVAPAPSRIRVDIFDAFSGAFRSVFGRLGLFWRAAWPPALVFSGLITAFYLELFRNIGNRLSGSAPPNPEDLLLPILLPAVILGVVMTLVLFAFVARWMQVLLDPSPPGWLDPRTIRGFGRFLLCYLGVMVGFMLLVAALFLVAGLLVALFPAIQHSPPVLLLMLMVALAIYVAGGLCAARFALLFPAAMLDRPLSPGRAWRLMEGNTWRMAVTVVVLAIVSEIGLFAIIFVVEIVLLVLGLGIAAVLASSHVDLASPALATGALVGGSVLLGLFMTAIEFLLMGLFATVPAFFYRKLVLEPEVGIRSVF